MHAPNPTHTTRAEIDTSVIVPCFDAADTLGDLLASLAAQTETRTWEVVIADNGSEDGTLDVAAAYRDRLPAVRTVDASARTGASYARNEGARHAAGTNLVFVDADDVVGVHWLARLLDAIPEDGVAASRFEGTDVNDPEAREFRSCPQQDGLMSFRYAPFLPFASASGLAMRRETFEALGGFDPALLAGEDIDLCWRAQLDDRPLRFAEDAVLHYRLRSERDAILRQARTYGYWTVPLYERYREHGMPRVPVRSGLAAWAKLFARMPRALWSEGSRTRWLKQFSYRWGLLRGSIAFRTVAI